MKLSFFSILAVALLIPSISYAKCKAEDKLCMMGEIKKITDGIEKKSWRDQTLRELAKSYAYEGQESKAIALIDEIQTPDTKAMTIRGIGMAAADSKWKNKEGFRDKERYNKLFENLAKEAEKIEHLPSHAIAYTYIAMSQAFAKDDDGAMKTAKGMTNDALRHKAFAETAEIQAERGKFDLAMASIKEIESDSFRNKAYGTVAKIFVKRGELQSAYDTVQKMDNPYTKAMMLQIIVNHGNAEETLPHSKKK